MEGKNLIKKESMSKKDVIKIGSKHYYVERDKKGQFIEITSIGKLIKSDSKNKSAKPSHDHARVLKRNKK